MADEADCDCWILPANILAGMADSRVVLGGVFFHLGIVERMSKDAAGNTL
jgi:hypothetical protein